MPGADLDYAALLRFRTALRQFNRWSEEQAAAVGLTHIQHQLLLAVKGHRDFRGPTISDAAEYLLVRHHSVVELATRVEALGFLARHQDHEDGRVVRLKLTAAGEDRIRALTEVHVRELASLAPLLQALVDASKAGNQHAVVAARRSGAAVPNMSGADTPSDSQRTVDGNTSKS